MESIILEPKCKDPECTPVEYRMDKRKMWTKSKGWVTHKEFTDYLRDTGKPREVHSDGFLYVSKETVYECKCGFEGIFKSDKCARCGAVL